MVFRILHYFSRGRERTQKPPRQPRIFNSPALARVADFELPVFGCRSEDRSANVARPVLRSGSLILRWYCDLVERYLLPQNSPTTRISCGIFCRWRHCLPRPIPWLWPEFGSSGPEIPQIGRCWQKLMYTPADNNHSIVRKRRRLPPALRFAGSSESRFEEPREVEHKG